MAETGTDAHTRVYSGDVIWCATCGPMPTKKVHGMQTMCKGAPQRGTHSGGMWGQLRKLMRRIHPETWDGMQEHFNPDGSLWGPRLNLYAKLRVPENPEPPQEGFDQYVPVARPPPIPTVEGVVHAAVEARRQRKLNNNNKGSKAACAGLHPSEKDGGKGLKRQ